MQRTQVRLTMTEQKYVPSTFLVRLQYSRLTTKTESEQELEDEFDRWYAAEIDAAEQRGAIKALRDAAGAIEKNQIMTQVGHLQPCNSCMVIHMDFLDYRADLLEGDDE